MAGWLCRGAGRFFPEAWARFRYFAGLTDTYRLPTDSTPPIPGLLQAYSQMMEDPGIGVRSRAAAEWTAWEDAVISQESNGTPGAYGDRPDDAKLTFVRICSHYFAHDGFLEDGVLIREAGQLAGIPGVLIHGRNDLGGGACTPWEWSIDRRRRSPTRGPGLAGSPGQPPACAATGVPPQG